MVTKDDVQVVDDLMQKLISKLHLLGIKTDRLEDVCYDVLYEVEKLEEASRCLKES